MQTGERKPVDDVFGSAVSRTIVMMALLSAARRALCTRTAAASSMLDTVSADTSTKSALMMSFWSITRSASPADRQLVLTTRDTCEG